MKRSRLSCRCGPIPRPRRGWRSARTLWQRRAAAVAFVNLAKRGEANFPGFIDMLLATCAPLVASQERFAQTGAGWVLRELSLADPERVTGFVEDHVSKFSREGLSYATEKLPAESKARLKALLGARGTLPEDTHRPGSTAE